MTTYLSLKLGHNGKSDVFISEKRILFHDIAQSIAVALHLCPEHVRAVHSRSFTRPPDHVFLVHWNIKCLSAVGRVSIDVDVDVVALWSKTGIEKLKKNILAFMAGEFVIIKPCAIISKFLS